MNEAVNSPIPASKPTSTGNRNTKPHTNVMFSTMDMYEPMSIMFDMSPLTV